MNIEFGFWKDLKSLFKKFSWNNLKEFFAKHWLTIFLVLLLVILIIWLIFILFKKVKGETLKRKIDDNVLVCPIRGVLKRRKYASNGNYSEEYQTIRLVKWFLRRGYGKEQIIFEYIIRIGRDGHNTLRVDLVVKKNERFFVVAEVKNNSKEIESAIKHQLIPAMRILNAKYGIYFDGSEKSRLLIRKDNGDLGVRKFP